MRDVWAVVVARTGPKAKTRLAPALDAEARSALAVAMLTDVLRATRKAGLVGIVAVLDPPQAPIEGTVTLPDPGEGLVRAVEAGIGAAVASGARSVIVLPGDIPLLEARDVRMLAAAPPAVVVVPDRSGTGTNALVLRPPTVIAPAFGPGSAARHLSAARVAGAEARLVERANVALDIDTPGDLAELVRRRPAGATGVALRRTSAGREPRPGRAGSARP